MSDLPPMNDEAVKQAQWLWDIAYKHAVHSVGITDWSTATFEDKKRVDIQQAVLFKSMNSTINMIRLATAIRERK